jgi:dTDP-4-dehydrorhamnose reductase
LFSRDPGDTSFAKDIKQKLASNETITAASDQFICMTNVEETASAISLLMQQKCSGIYHLAGPEKLTRYSLARRIATPMKALNLVEECSIDDFVFDESRPKDNTLNTDKISQELNFDFSKF